MTDVLKLRPYQEGMRAFAGATPSCALWADMGLGKTPTALAVMADSLYDRLDVERWLVVAPRLVARDAWPRQLRRWRQFAGIPWRLVGPADFGLRAAYDEDTGRRTGLTFGGREAKAAVKRGLARERHPVTLVSWDWLPWLVKAWGRSWPYDGIVLDEAIFAANSESIRHRSVWHVVHNLRATRRVIELTGAPTPNGYEALHGQIRLLDGGERLGKTKGDFRDRWLVPDKRDKGRGLVFSWRLAPGARERIDRALAGLCVALATADYLTLPELVLNQITVTLPDAARELYDRMERELLIELDGVEILSESAGAKALKLMQIANGAVYDGERQAHFVHSAKLDRLDELLEAEPGPVLLAYSFKPEWAAIRARFKFARHVNDPGALDAFRAGRLKLLCMHPGSGAHGTDGLQEASSCAVWFGATYNADHWQQFNKRLHRDGTRADRVVVHQLLAEDTLEENVACVVLAGKLSRQEALLHALKMRLSSRT